MAEWADGSAAWDSVWVGDSIFAKPRLDAMALLGALAARTQHVRLGPACFASTPLRDALILAYQWASLDLMSGGRTVFVACQGQPEPGGGAFDKEFEALGIEPGSRMRRMEEAIEIMRLTSSREHVDYDGKYNKFRDLTVLPRPVQQPIPIWVVSNPNIHKPPTSTTGYRRVARLGDGWMTTCKTPADVARLARDDPRLRRGLGRELGDDFEVCVYYNINVNENREAALAESKRFLDDYYRSTTARLPRVMVRAGLAGRMHREPAELHRCRRDDHHAAPDGLRSEEAVQARDRGRPAGLRLELTRAMDRARSCQRQIGRRHDPRPSKPDRQAGAIIKPARSRPSGLRGSPRTP